MRVKIVKTRQLSTVWRRSEVPHGWGVRGAAGHSTQMRNAAHHGLGRVTSLLGSQHQNRTTALPLLARGIFSVHPRTSEFHVLRLFQDAAVIAGRPTRDVIGLFTIA